MRADRLVSIIMLLQSRGKMTTQALATALEVSRRTILRDIDALSISGIPIYTDGGHGGGVALDEQYRTTLTGLKADEVQALFVGSNHQLLEEIGLGDAVESTQRKLSAALPTQHQGMVEQFRQRIYIDPRWWWHEPQSQTFWRDLQDAVYQDRCIQVLYETYSGEVSQRTLEPYSLVAKSSLWYLVAKEVDKHGDEWRTFRVARCQQLQILPTAFQRDPTFDLATYWQEHLAEFTSTFAEYEFTLRIHPDRVNFARWLTPGRNQVLDMDLPDINDPDTAGPHTTGWVTMRFQIENEALAKMLVFGLGNQCIIIAPDRLHDSVQTACVELITRPFK